MQQREYQHLANVMRTFQGVHTSNKRNTKYYCRSCPAPNSTLLALESTALPAEAMDLGISLKLLWKQSPRILAPCNDVSEAGSCSV